MSDIDDFNYISPFWRLADFLNLEQAAALIAGYDPNLIRYNSQGGVYFETETGLTDSCGAHNVQTAFSALKNAVVGGKLKVKIVHDSRPVTNEDSQTLVDMMECGEYFNPGYEQIADDIDCSYKNGYFIRNQPDWEKTLINVDELKTWLESKGFRSEFFFPSATDAPLYLDPKHPRYAPKLAAAVNAWLEIGNLAENNGKSVKQSLMKWLRENASLYRLSDEDGKPNETGIEECAKVANWQDKGGAPKTPGG